MRPDRLKELLEDVAAGLREGGTLHRIRIAAAHVVLRDYLPVPLQRIRNRFQPLSFTLVSPPTPEMLRLLAREVLTAPMTREKSGR